MIKEKPHNVECITCGRLQRIEKGKDRICKYCYGDNLGNYNPCPKDDRCHCGRKSNPEGSGIFSGSGSLCTKCRNELHSRNFFGHVRGIAKIRLREVAEKMTKEEIIKLLLG